jgi:DNA-binding MarR family transcriptional regulator
MTIIAGSDTNLRDEAFHLFGRLVAFSDPGRLDRWASLGLTITQLRVLFILRGEPGLTAGVLAERMQVTPSTLTRIMDRVARDELVERVPDADDRRCVRHNLSDRGLALVSELESNFRARMDRVFDQLDAETLRSVVKALKDLTDAHERATAGETGSAG